MILGQQDKVDDNTIYNDEPVDIASKIETLEDRFDDLRTRIIDELSAKPGITVQGLLDKLTSLPVSLKKEYESSIAMPLPNMRAEININELFVHLNPLTSFIDYGLIEHFIRKFGSDTLKDDMRSYCSEMIMFMKETTIKQLIDHLPGQADTPPNFSLIEAKIGQNASECTLEQLNTIGKRYCSEVKLSEIVFHLVAVVDVESNSFIVRWLVPSAIVSDILKSTKSIKQSLFLECKIISLTLDGMWLFVSEAEMNMVWSRMHVSYTKFKDQFHTMFRQIMYELELQGISKHELLLSLKDQQPHHQSYLSIHSSRSFQKRDSCLSLVGFTMITAVIQRFGSDCLKRVTKYYCDYVISIYTSLSTAQQLIALSPIPSNLSKYFTTAECRIMEKPLKFGLEKLLSFQTQFCTSVHINKVCFVMSEVDTDTSDSFIVRWLVPSALVSHIIQSTKNVKQGFYKEYKITTFTLDTMWLYLKEAEIDAMWLRVHVDDTKFKDQFQTMYKQILFELEMQGISKYDLSQHLMDQQPHFQDYLSKVFQKHDSLLSLVGCKTLVTIIERFGSDCLKRVMKSYRKYVQSICSSQLTVQQLLALSSMPLKHSKYFVTAECRIVEKPLMLNKLLSFQTRFCNMLNINRICFVMIEMSMEVNDSFIVRWILPSAITTRVVKSANNAELDLYQACRITSFTIDTIWLYLSEGEIDKMWSQVHASDTRFRDQFHTMYKQIVHELEIGDISEHDLSLYLMEQQPKLQKQVSDHLSEAILKRECPSSFIDFRVLTIIIERFGSNCLKRVMMSYCKYMSAFTKQSTVQRMVDLPSVQSKPSKYFITVKCMIEEEPSGYRFERLLCLQSELCHILDIDDVCFVMDEISIEMSCSFNVSWLVPSPLISNIMKSASSIPYQKYKITSFTLDSMWLYMSESEVSALWSWEHVSSTKFRDQFHTMYKQILCELKMEKVSVHNLSLCLMNQPPKFDSSVSLCISKAFLEQKLSSSFKILNIIIERFGSDCLKRVMKSFCKQSTVQQVIDLSAVQFKPPSDIITAKCKFEEEPSGYRLERLLCLHSELCRILDIDDVCFVMDEIKAEMSGSFTVSWFVPSPLISNIMKSARNILYQKYKIICFTLDSMWLCINESECSALWSVSNIKFKDHFHTIFKQILCELELEKVSEDDLSLYLMNQPPKVDSNVSLHISKAFLEQKLSSSFGILSIIIERFGSDCLKRVMKSICKQSTVQQLVDLSAVQFKPFTDFITAECRIMEEPSHYKLEKLLLFQSRFCTLVNVNNVCFVMVKISQETSGSFTISWLIPSSLAFDMLKSVNQIKETELFEKFNIASLQLGSGWLYHHQLTPFGANLKERYQQSQGLPSPVEWIPSPTKKIFRLAMIQRERVQQGHIEDRFARMTIRGRVDDILHAKSPVELEHIFRNTVTLHGGEIILIEGAPGSGKSTLAVHICQRWGKGELFQQFTVVILVQLRDPVVQRAHTITYLLPVKHVTVARELASELKATNGCGVLWVLDGWDELPPRLQQNSMFCKLIQRKLSECSVIVTSRPISSGDLHPVVSSRIEVLGFTPEEQRQYFTECLNEDTKALDALLEKIQENPVVQSICYLPLNAAFVVYTFKCRGQSLPNTEYEIYSSVILSCVQRHYEREGRGHDLPRELASLDDLSRSEAMRVPFQCLCDLAYRGVMENKVTFSSCDLPQGSNTLSLLQAIESFLQSGKSVFYNFLHLSIQEVLSAYYIATWLSDIDQVSQFQQLFNQPRFAAVFQFYAAFTKLNSPGIRLVIARIVEAKSKPLLLSLLRCLHEAQDPSLCLHVAEMLKYEVCLSNTSLSPRDCLSISFFLFSIAGKEISVDLQQCYIGDLGIKCLSKYSGNGTDHVIINLKDNEIHDEGASHVAKMLYYIEHLHLNLSKNPIGDTGASLILEAVRKTATLKTLIMIGCTVFSNRIKDTFMALGHNNSLQKFDMTCNYLGSKEVPQLSLDLIATVNKTGKACAFANLDAITKAKLKVSNHFSALEELDSFRVSWCIPVVSIPISYLMETAREIEAGRFDTKHILSLSVGSVWLYNSKLGRFSSMLKKQYQQSSDTPSPVELIPSPTKKIFRLAMIQRERVQRGHIGDSFVRMSISDRVDDILHAKSPMELEHIFRNTLHGGEIILIEGAPGSGKSTLMVHICEGWGKGELFQQFIIVILVPLQDPVVQKAQTIADLLPVENAAVAQELATEIIATNGRGVLWVLDGWDELPPHLQQDSIICILIKRMLSESSVIITSRPISSGDIHPMVSSRLEVLGFTPEEQRQYFTECLKEDTKALEVLLKKIQRNLVVQNICYLPLNATFIVHTFKYKSQSLPNTVYEICLSVILSCIQRHFEREGRGHDLPGKLASLDDLFRSEAVREPLQCLCELAYRGVMENKVAFSSSDLPQGSSTLGLLQAVESFLQSGKSVFYNFFHLSVQEVLSAYYIATWLSDSEQVSRFQQLHNQPRFAAVFQFYAAITKLKNPGIRQVIARMVEAKSKPLLLYLLRFLHEAQDPSLCHYIAEKINYELDFRNLTLSAVDYLCVSFFLSSLSGKEVVLILRRCTIGDIGTKCLANYFSHGVHSVSKVTIDLIDSQVTGEDASYISRLFYFVECLYLSYNPIGDTGASLISKAINETTTLKILTIYDCGITSRGAEDLSRALAQNSSLEKFDISRNNLGDEGISHVSEALKQNKQLKELWIGGCRMTDKGAACLASALRVNNSLKMLHMGRGDHKEMLTNNEISAIVQSLTNKSKFVKLVIPHPFDSTVDQVSQEVNDIRKRNGLPPIKIKGKYCM